MVVVLVIIVFVGVVVAVVVVVFMVVVYKSIGVLFVVVVVASGAERSKVLILKVRRVRVFHTFEKRLHFGCLLGTFGGSFWSF